MSGWEKVWFPISWPSFEALIRGLLYQLACLPTTKKVPLTLYLSSTSKISCVSFGWGPSSNVNAISFSSREPFLKNMSLFWTNEDTSL